MTAYSIQETVILETIHCSQCGTTFAIPDFMKKERMDNGGTFYCPNGHPRAFTKPKCQRLQEELDQKAKELTASRCETIAERQKRETSERELKRHTTRTKNGVCPCCNRSFANLRRHIATKHPTFTP